MALPLNRTQLKEYALRKLGHPVIQINIAPEQMDDRIDEALQLFQFNHFDAVERTYLKHKIVLTKVFFPAPILSLFQEGELIIGQTSGNKAKVIRHDLANDYVEVIILEESDKSFDVGETIEGEMSAVTATVDSVVLGDIENGFISLPDNVLSIRKILPLSFRSKDILFDVRYRLALSSIPDLLSFDLVGYNMFQRHLSLVDFMLNAKPSMNFNKFSGRLYINFDWYNEVSVDEYIVIDADVILDINEFNKIYTEEWLRDYVVALFREQWAQNLSKYENVQLPGGVTLNVADMRTRAEQDISKLKEDLLKKWQRPARPMIG